MYYIGIDLGGTYIKIGLVYDGSVIGIRRLDSESSAGLGRKLIPMAEAVNSLLEEHGVYPDNLGGIGLAFPGIVDVISARAAATNAKWSDAPDIDLTDWVRTNWKVPFRIDNDARMAAAGEWKAGAGKGKSNMVMMTIGTGIGTGVVVDGHLLYGKNFCAGALGGHMIVDYRGRRCTCGNVGCVEAHSSSFFLPQIISSECRIDERFRNDKSNYDFRTLFAKYRQGDGNAVMIVESCMDVWSAAIVNYVHAYDPEAVVLGGGVMRSSDIILPYVRKKVEALAWCPGKVEIVSSELGDDAAVIGAACSFRNML